MSAPTVITITDGVLLLADTEAGLATGIGYECQVTEASINATPNLQTVPATFCAPESQVPAATGFELAVTWLQDWSAPGGGLSNFAFIHDTEEKWFSLALDADLDTVLATGQVRLVAGAYGGAAGTPLTATATWPLATKPTIGVPNAAGPATGATAGTPGTWTPAGSTPPANAAAAGAVAATPNTAWATGEYVQGTTSGVPGEMHWDGAAWVAGIAP